MDEPLSADAEASGAGNGAASEMVPRRIGKSASAFRTISEVAGELDVPQHVLRFWETRFSQIRPLKRAGGRRYYRPEDVELLRRIREFLYQQGYTIRGVQKLLRDGSLGGTAVGVGVGEGELLAETPEPIDQAAPAPTPAQEPSPAPAVAASDHAASDHAASDHVAPDHAAPDHAAVEAVISELTALRDLLRLHAKPQGGSNPGAPADRAAAEATIGKLKELRADTTLDGLSWKELRDEGRK